MIGYVLKEKEILKIISCSSWIILRALPQVGNHPSKPFFLKMDRHLKKAGSGCGGKVKCGRVFGYLSYPERDVPNSTYTSSRVRNIVKPLNSRKKKPPLENSILHPMIGTPARVLLGCQLFLVALPIFLAICALSVPTNLIRAGIAGAPSPPAAAAANHTPCAFLLTH